MRVDLAANVLVMDDGTIIRLCRREAEVASVMVDLGPSPMQTIADRVWANTAVPYNNARTTVFDLRSKLKAQGFDLVVVPKTYAIRGTRRS
jgi:predicted lipoprotein